MPEIKEDVLVSIQLEQDEGAFKKLADLKNVLIENKKAQNQLNEDFRKGIITSKEYASDIVRLEANHKKLNAEYSKTQRSVTGLKNPLTEINESLKKQTALIGGATPALDKMTGGAVSSAQGLFSMAKGALAFIATPIGLVIGALGLAFGALTAYIKGSDEGSDRFAITTASLGFVFEKLKIVVENVGGFIFDTIEFIAGGVERIIGFVNPAAGLAIEAAKKAGAKLANLQDDIENRENAALVRRAEVNERVQNLREAAITQEGDLKRKTIKEAIDLEKQLAKEEEKLSQSRLDAFNLENKARIEANKLSGDDLRKQKELEADVINKRAAGAQSTIKFQKELERLNDEARKSNAEKEALDRAERHAASREADEIELADLTTRQETELALTTSFEHSVSNASISFRKQNTANKLEQDKLIVAYESAKNKQLESLQNQALAFGNQIAGRSRALMTGLTLISTYFAAQKAFESQFLPVPTAGSPIRGAIAAGIAIASGLFRVAQINQVGSFYEGGFGYTGEGNPRQESRALGIKPYTYHKDEYITPSRILNTPEGAYHVNRLEAMRTGKRSFESGGFSGGGGMSQSQFNDLLNKINTVQTVLVVERFEEVQGRMVEVKERATF